MATANGAASDPPWREYLDGLPVALFALDSQGRPAFANARALQMLGRGIMPQAGPDELSTVYPSFIAGTDTPYPAEKMPIVRALSHRESSVVDDVELERDGQRIPIEAWAAPVLDEHGDVAHSIAVFFDITARRELEAARDAAEAATQQQATLLRQSNEMLEQFAFAASHDLQAPLRNIRSFTQLLGDELGPDISPDAKEFMAEILAGTQRMQERIDGILGYSQVQGAPLAPEKLPIQELAKNIRAELAEEIAASGATVEARGEALLVADAALMGQILQNLVANAIQYHGEETPHIEISFERTHDMQRLRVRDNGIGVPEDREEQIFEMFRRGVADPPGHGIGLAVCRAIMQRHQGTITAERNPKGGSTFTLQWPTELRRES